MRGWRAAFRKKYQNLSVLKKLLYSIVPIIIVFILLVMAATSAVFYNVLVNKATQNLQEEYEMIEIRMESLYNSATACANTVTKNINSIAREHDLDDLDEIGFIQVRNQLFTLIDYERISYPEISSIVFLSLGGDVVYSGFSSPEEEPVQANRVLEEMVPLLTVAKPPMGVFYPLSARPYLNNLSDEVVLTLGKRIIQMDTGEDVGYLFLNIGLPTLFDNYPDESAFQDKQNYIMDGLGAVYASAGGVDSAWLHDSLEGQDDGVLQLEEEGKRSLVVKRTLPELGLILAGQLSYASFTGDIRTNMALLLGVGVLCLALAVVFWWGPRGASLRPYSSLPALPRRCARAICRRAAP